MANYISGPIFAFVGIVEGVINKTKELIETVLGRGDISEEGQAE